MIYIASCYSSPVPELVQSRYEQTLTFTERLLLQGFIAFSPIVYLHNIARRLGLPADHGTWMKFNMDILRKAEAAYVLCLPGWEKSKGLEVELKVCKMLDIPAVKYDATFRLMDEEWRGKLVEQF